MASWPGGLPDLIRATPPDTISFSVVADRWTGLPGTKAGQGRVTLAGDALHPQTPNLGQGKREGSMGSHTENGGLSAGFFFPFLSFFLSDFAGACTALEDAIELAAAVGSLSLSSVSVPSVLRRYERGRVRRCLPLTLRAHAIGALLQNDWAPVVAIRDAVAVPKLLPVRGFLGHTEYDCTEGLG